MRTEIQHFAAFTNCWIRPQLSMYRPSVVKRSGSHHQTTNESYITTTDCAVSPEKRHIIFCYSLVMKYFYFVLKPLEQVSIHRKCRELEGHDKRPTRKQEGNSEWPSTQSIHTKQGKETAYSKWNKTAWRTCLDPDLTNQL